MKWFSHACDEKDREFFDLVYDTFQHEGYAVWYQMKEVLGVEIERELDAFRNGRQAVIRPIMTVNVQWLARRCRTTAEFVIRFARWAREERRLSIAELSRNKERITIEMPNLLDDIDEYFKRTLRDVCAERKIDPKTVLIVSGPTPDKVRTPSGQSRADYSRGSTPQGAEQTGRTEPEGAGPGDGAPKADATASPLPPAPPRAAAAAVAAAAASPYLPEGAAPEADLSKPHLLGVLVLLRHMKFTLSQAMDYGSRIPVREICGVAREAGGKQSPGGYARSLLDRRLRRETPLSIDEARDILVLMGDLNGKWRTDRRPGESEESFVRRLGSGGMWAAVLDNVRVQA